MDAVIQSYQSLDLDVVKDSNDVSLLHAKIAERECIRRLTLACQLEHIPIKPNPDMGLSAVIDHMRQDWQRIDTQANLYFWDSFKQELLQSIDYHQQFMIHRQLYNRLLLEKTSEYGGFWYWLVKSKSQAEQVSFLEQWGAVGHPYHPNFKAKSGMNIDEILRYSPEFFTDVNLSWYALHHQHVVLSELDKSYTSILLNAMPKLSQLLIKSGLNPEEYFLIPVHPWQKEHRIRQDFQSLLNEKKLIEIPGCLTSTKPSMSFRTMIHDSGLHLKLPVGVHTTSAMRTVSPASAHNGPRLSKVINQILSDNHHFNEMLYLMADLAGLHSAKKMPENLAKHLGVILRQNPLEFLEEQETLVPFASLFIDTPNNHQPLLIEIINASGIASEQYFEYMVRLLLNGPTQLYLRYGIALESHQQNSLVAFDETHKPSKLLNRDLGGIRIQASRLNKAGYDIELYQGSIIKTEAIDEVRNKYIHANLQSNVAYVIKTLSQHFDLSMKQQWKIVKTNLLDIFGALQGKVESNFLAREADILLHDPWQHKCLTRMRLEQCDGYILQPIDNPLRNL